MSEKKDIKVPAAKMQKKSKEEKIKVTLRKAWIRIYIVNFIIIKYMIQSRL